MNHTTSLAKRQSIFGSHIITMTLVGLVLIIFHSSTAQAQWTTNGNNINNTNSGNVGIGTSDPSVGGTENWNRLTVQGNDTTAVTTGIINVGSGHAGLILRRTGTTPSRWYQYMPAGSTDLRFYNGGDLFTLQSGGNVGIGTTSPTSRLHVTDSTYNTYAARFMHSNPSASNGVYIETQTVLASDAALQIASNSGGNQLLMVRNNGNVGIGTTGPTSRLVVGGDGQQTELQGDLLLSRTGSTPYVYNNHSTNNMAFRTGGSGKLLFQPDTGTGDIDFFNGKMVVKNGGNVGIGTNSPTSKLHVVGDLTVTGNIAAKYQDLAEWVPARQAMNPGTVVVLDPLQSNQVMPSVKAYDTTVAGVVSAKPGLTLGESGSGKLLIATTGRVRIKVDARSAPIQIGDLLVTSDNEGMAMKSEPLKVGGRLMHMPGTLIGKALEPLVKGTGEILVLLSLQ